MSDEVIVIDGVEFGVSEEGTVYPLGDSTPGLVRSPKTQAVLDEVDRIIAEHNRIIAKLDRPADEAAS